MNHLIPKLPVCLALLALALPVCAQEERLYFRDGSNNYEYECVANATVGTTRFGRAGSTSGPPLPGGTITTLTSIVVSSNTATANITAHGLRVGARITVSGATVDEDLNASYLIATVPGANSFTFTTANVSNATYNEATLVLSTTVPRSNANVWAVLKRFYTAAYLDREAWAYGSAAKDKACDSKATYF